MIKRYIQLFFRISIISSFLVTIVILLAWYKKAEPVFELTVLIYLFSTLIVPLLIIFLGWVSETYFKRQRELIFNSSPLLNIQPDKFELLELKSKSKWFPSYFVLKGQINGYNGFLNVLQDEIIKVRVTFPFEPISNETKKRISLILKPSDFKVYDDNICKTYRKRKIISMTENELVEELEFATSTLKTENIKTENIGWC